MGKTLESRLHQPGCGYPRWAAKRTPSLSLGGFTERLTGSSCLIQLLFTIFCRRVKVQPSPTSRSLVHSTRGHAVAIEQKARMVRNKLLVIVEPHRKIVSLKRKREFRNKVDLLAREAVVGQIVHARP